MSTRLYIGNIPFNTTEEELTDFFKDAGHHPDSVKIITDRDTGRSKGFGFVEINEQDDAEKAIGNTNGQKLGGRALTVNLAKPREETTGAGGRGRR